MMLSPALMPLLYAAIYADLISYLRRQSAMLIYFRRFCRQRGDLFSVYFLSLTRRPAFLPSRRRYAFMPARLRHDVSFADTPLMPP